VRYAAELFPLTHFCRAFRRVNMYQAGIQFYATDLLILLAGAVVTFVGAAILLQRMEE
jgi:ABC-type polysaccharide/polyol phosphate export permease